MRLGTPHTDFRKQPTRGNMSLYPRLKNILFRVGTWKGGSLALALLAQAVIVLVAGVVVVMTPPRDSEPEFEAAQTVQLPQRELEHRVAVSEFQQATGNPRVVERLSTSALVPEGLPEVSTAAASEFSPMESSDFMAQDARALLGDSGIMGALSGLEGAESTSSFFGLEATGERIVILVNTSASVINKARNRGVSVERIQEEMIGVIEGLAPATQFGIVQFSQGVRAFENYLAPATAANIDTVKNWVPENLRGNPRAATGQEYYGHEAGFAEAFALDPDVIFLVTDGQLNRREGSPGDFSYPTIPYSELLATLQGLQREASSDVRINVVGFEMRASDARKMRRLVTEFGGQLREF